MGIVMGSRSEYLANVRSVVVKLGTQLLSDSDGRIDAPFVANIAEQVTRLRRDGVRVTIVSSGAIGCGLREMGLNQRPTDLAKLQAIAAVGQRRLMDIWADAFEPHQLAVAQMLLTRQDIDDRTRFLNLRDTISAVHEMNAIPIVNENDTVSTAELVKITFGDNDILAALLAHAMRADLLVLLTVVDGLLGEDDKPVRLVKRAEDGRSLVREEKSDFGKGGMDSKLQAAQMVNDAGDAMIVADGRIDRILPRLLAGEELGTLFTPAAAKKRSSRSRWIGAVRPAGTIMVDEGARRALVEQNKSLLPAGIVKVEGEFARGDVVAIQGPDGKTIARGLSNYSAGDMDRVRGKKTQQVRELLAEAAYDEAVHRDNLVVERNG
ncbi:MAG TPA: glutamate 5-kinase [Tepidisphaeraceae bacterium]|jgi:glutamate 5-kinase|nr:glutamate 5-kinase [Tepidisphaeraceae bacterium]